MDDKNTSAPSFLPLPILRAVALLLSLTILVGDPAWATGVSDLMRTSFSHDLRDLSVPAKFGTVTDKWLAPRPSPFVVLIQDLHANISVQKNIAQVIEYLYHRVRAPHIYVEAAFGACDVSVLRSLPSRREQNRFEEKLLSKALLTGDELAAASIGKGPLSPVTLEGVDDPLLYLANVQAFGDLVKAGPHAAREWKALRDILLPGAAPQLRRHLELTEKLLGLKLLDSEWLEYKDHRDLTPHGSPVFMTAVAAAERFYTAAEARNGALADNLLQKLGVSDEGRGTRGVWREKIQEGTVKPSSLVPRPSSLAPVVLVTGGFHTASIAHVLKQCDISFMVVTPQVERLDQDELYIQSMTEPPHETVRAIAASNYAIARVKSLMLKLNMANHVSWLVGRETYQPKSISLAHPEGLTAARTWLDPLEELVALLSEWTHRLRQSVQAVSQNKTIMSGTALAVFYGFLSHAGAALHAAVHLAPAQVGLTAPALVASGMGLASWFLTFTASTVIPLAALTLAARIAMRQAKGSRLESYARKAFKAYHDWAKNLKNGHRAAAKVAELPIELAQTMYGFAFEHSNRLLAIMDTGRLDEKAAIAERWFHALPEWLQPLALPFFATHRIISKRLLLKATSTLGQVLVVGALASLLSFITPHHSVNALSHVLNFNLLGSNNGLVHWLQGSALGTASWKLGSVFGYVNAYVLSLLMLIGRRIWEQRSRGLKAALVLALQPIEIRDKSGKLLGKTSIWRANLSGALGMHTVGVEIEALKTLSHGFSLSNDVVMKIEGQEGVLGAGEEFVRHALHPLGVDPGQLITYLPGTQGLTLEQIEALTKTAPLIPPVRDGSLAPVRAAAAAGAGGSGGGDGGPPPDREFGAHWYQKLPLFNSLATWLHPIGVLAGSTASGSTETKNISIVAGSDGRLRWMAQDGTVLPMRQGTDYQPTEGGNHIYNDYIAPHRLPDLYAQLLDPSEISRLKSQTLFDGFTGEGRGHAEKLKAMGITSIRIYQAPLDDGREIEQFKAVMRLAAAHGIHVYFSDMLGLYDHPNDQAWMRERVKKLAAVYGSEPWLAAFGLGNENDRYIRGGDTGDVKLTLTTGQYYALMDDLAGVMHQEMATRGTRRPIFLGNGWPHEEKGVDNYFAQLKNIDGIGFNLYTSPAGLRQVLDRMRQVNAKRSTPLRVVISEFGQDTRALPGMSPAVRAADFERQVEVLKQYPDLVASWFYFEATSEQWKVSEEGRGADLHGILDKPAIAAVTSKYRETAAATESPTPAATVKPPSPPQPAPTQPKVEKEQKPPPAPPQALPAQKPVPKPAPKAQSASKEPLSPEEAELRARNQIVKDAAARRLKSVEDKVGHDVKVSQQQLDDTLAALTATRMKQGEARDHLKALEAALMQPGHQIDPHDVTVTDVLGLLDAFQPSRYAADARAIRSAYPTFAKDPRLKSAEDFAASWTELQNQLQALQTSGSSGLSSPEAARLIQRINSTLEASRHAADVIAGLKSLLGLFTASGTIPPALERQLDDDIARFQDSRFENAEAGLQNFRNGLTDLTALRDAQDILNEQAMSLERQSQELSEQNENAPEKEAQAISPEERAWIAARLEVIVSDGGIERLVADGDALAKDLPANTRWAPYFKTVLDALRVIAAERQNLLNDSLNPASQLESLRQSLLAIGRFRTVQSDLRVFDYAHNPNFESDVRGLSNPTAYEIYIRRLTSGLAIQHLQELLQATISMSEQENNIDIEIKRRQAGADAQQGTAIGLESQEERQNMELRLLRGIQDQVRADAETAARQAPHVSATPHVDKESLTIFAAFVATVTPEKLKYAKSKNKDINVHVQALQDAVMNLKNTVDKLNGRLTPNGALDKAEQEELTSALFGVLDRFPDFVNPAFVKGDIEPLMQATAHFTIEYMGGLSEERLQDGVSAEDTFEDRAIRLLGQVDKAAHMSSNEKKYLDYLNRTTGVRGWTWNVLQALNIAYGLKNAKANFNTLAGRNKYAFEVRTGPPIPNPPGGVIFTHFKKVAKVKAAEPVDILLGAANGYVNAEGVKKETQVILGSRDPDQEVAYFAAHLDPKVFRNLAWTHEHGNNQFALGQIYFSFRDGSVLKAAAPEQQVTDTSRWLKVEDSFSLEGHFYTVVGKSRYIWVAGKKIVSVGEKVRAIKNAADSAILTEQILHGFLSGDTFKDHLVDVPANFADRYAALLQFHGLGKSIVHFVDSMHYEKTVNSEYGNFLHGKAPKIISTVLGKNSANESVTMRITENGQVLFERIGQDGKRYLDDESGTVLYAYDRGPLRAITDAVFDFQWKSIKYFQVSKKLARETVTSPSGFFVKERRPHSAEVLEVDADHIKTKIKGDWQTYQVGASIEISDKGESFEVRPYYLPSPNPRQPPIYLGVIRTANGHFLPDKSGAQIDRQSIWTMVTTRQQEMNYFRALMEEGSWLPVDNEGSDLQAQILEKEQGWPTQEKWLRSEGGIDLYIPLAGQEPTFMRWTDHDGTTYLINQKDPKAKIYYRIKHVNGHDQVETKIASLSDYAKTKELVGQEGVWRKDDKDGLKPSPEALLLPVLGSADSEMWLDATGLWHMRTAGKGTYMYQMGGKGAQNAQENIYAPFTRHQPLPDLVDLDALVQKGSATRIQAKGPHGQETWYYFNQLTPGKAVGEFSGAFVSYELDGKAREEYVGFSKPGLDYQSTAMKSNDATFLSILFTPPKEVKDWVPTTKVPDAIQKRLGDGPMEAAFAYDPASAGIILRVVTNPNSASEAHYYFRVESTISGKQRIAEGQAVNGAWAPLGADLPDALVESLPGFKSGAFKKIGGQWHYAVHARETTTAELSPHARLVPAYDRMSDMPAAERATLSPRTAQPGHLTAYWGAGAENVEGIWYQKNVRQGKHKLSEWAYFEVGPKGGTYKDVVTGMLVTLEAGSVWVIHNTPASTEKFLRFNQGITGDWMPAQIDADTLAEATGLKHASSDAPTYTIPGTTITGEMLIPKSPNPYAPTVMLVTQGGALKNGENVVAGQALTYQLPAAFLAKIGRPQAGDMARVTDPSTGFVKTLNAKSLHESVFSGIKRIRDLDPKKDQPLLAQMKFPYTPDALVKIEDGNIVGQVQWLDEGLDALMRLQAKDGYVSLNVPVTNEKGHKLQGIVGIGDGKDELPFSWVTDKNNSRLNPVDRKGWQLIQRHGKSAAVLGNIEFGHGAAVRYAEKLLKPARALNREAEAGAPYEDKDVLMHEVQKVSNGPDDIYDLTESHLFSKLKVVEHRFGETLLSLSYLDPNGKIFKVVHFDQNKNPTYATDGAGFVTERYRAKEGTIAVYAPDGRTLLGLMRRDPLGHLLWRWNAFNHRLDVYDYESIVANGRLINQTDSETKHKKNESEIHMTQFTVTPKDLGLDEGFYDPRTAATSDKAARQSAPKLDPNHDPLNIDVPNKAKTVTGQTFYDPFYGTDKPLFHVNNDGYIDEVYQIEDIPQTEGRRIRTYHLPPGAPPGENPNQPMASPWNVKDYEAATDKGKWLDAVYEALLSRGKEISDDTYETRVYDPIGRLVAVEVDSPAGMLWLTRHTYVGDSETLLRSQLFFVDQNTQSKGSKKLVWDVYYPGFQTLDDALRSNWGDAKSQASQDLEKWVQAASGNLVDLKQRFREAGLNTPAGSAAQLTDEVRSSLGKAGITNDTLLQEAVVVMPDGGTWIDYRLPNDPLEQLVITNHGFDRTVSTDWKGHYVRYAFKLTPDNQVMGHYESDGSQAADHAFTHDMVKTFRRFAAHPLGIVDNPPNAWQKLLDKAQWSQYEGHTFWDQMKTFGISQNTALMKVVYKPRMPQRDKNGVLGFTDTDTKPNAWENMFVLPNDPMGRFLSHANGRVSLDLWWLERAGNVPPSSDGTERALYSQARQAPVTLLPGNVTIDKLLGGLTYGELGLFRGRYSDDMDEVSALADLSHPYLAHLKPTLRDKDLELLKRDTMNRDPDKRLDKKVVDDIERLHSSVYRGYWYDYVAANYKTREFRLRDGRLFILQSQSIASSLAQRWKGKEAFTVRIYLDPNSPVFKPLYAVNGRGELIMVWHDWDYVPIAPEEESAVVAKQIVDVYNPMTGHWTWKPPFIGGGWNEKTPFYYDQDGNPWVQSVPNRMIWANVISALGVGLLFILSRLGFGWFWRRKYRQFRARLDSLANVHDKPTFGSLMGGPDLGPLIAEAARQRLLKEIGKQALPRDHFGETIHPSEVAEGEDENILIKNGYAELGFLANLIPIYAYLMNMYLPKELRELDSQKLENQERISRFLISDPNFLKNVDRYIDDLGFHFVLLLSAEVPNKSTRLGELAKKMNVSADPEAKNKFVLYTHDLASRLKHELNRPNGDVESVLKDFGVSDGQFKEEHFDAWEKENSWETQRGNWRDWWRRFLGIHTKGINVYVTEFIILVPLFLILLTHVGAMFTGQIFGLSILTRADASLFGPQSVWLLGAVSILALASTVIDWLHTLKFRFIGEGTHPAAKVWRYARYALGITWAIMGSILMTVPHINVGIWWLHMVAGVIAFMEAYGFVFTRHSLLGLATFYQFKPTIGTGRPRIIAIVAGQILSFLALGVMIAGNTFGWWHGQFEMHSWWKLFGGFFVFNHAVYQLVKGLWDAFTAAFSFFRPSKGPMLKNNAEPPLPDEKDGSLIETVYNGPPLGSIGLEWGERAAEGGTNDRGEIQVGYINLLQKGVQDGNVELIRQLRTFQELGRNLYAEELKRVGGDSKDVTMPAIEEDLDKFVDTNVKEWLDLIHQREEGYFSLGSSSQLWDKDLADWDLDEAISEKKKEMEKKNRTSGVSFFYEHDKGGNTRFLHDETGELIRDEHGKPIAEKVEDSVKKRMEWALNLKHLTQLQNGAYSKTDFGQFDTYMNILALAGQVGQNPDLARRWRFVALFNKYNAHNEKLDLFQRQQHAKMRHLIAYLANRNLPPEERDNGIAQMVMTHTYASSKGANNNGFLHVRDLARVRAIHIMDRNDNNFELPELMADYRRMLRRPELVIMLANRGGIQSGEAAGAASDLGERGHNSVVQGMGGDEIGIGWSTIQGVVLQPLLAAASHPEYPVAAISKTLQDYMEDPSVPWFERMMRRQFGTILFSPNAIEQSEDLVGVWQTNYDTISLGGKPAYAMRVSRSMKLRESFNMLASFTAATRWSMGLAQALYQYLNQVIQIFGPLPVDEKDARRNVERHYLSAAINLLTLIIVPFSILLDFTPFVGINMRYWLAGLYFNQIGRAHGFVATVRDAGPSKLWGIIGAPIGLGLFYLVAWALSLPVHMVTAWPFALLAAWIGAMTGYSPIGFGRWLATTARDPMLFAARQIVEAYSFVKGTGGASNIFGLSQGSDGPEEYATFNSLLARIKTFSYGSIILLIGPAILGLIFFSFVYGLDFSNVVMLFPLIYYAISIVLGSFVYQNRQGVAAKGGNWTGRLGHGVGVFMGALAALGTYQFMSGRTIFPLITWAPIVGVTASLLGTYIARKRLGQKSPYWRLLATYSRKFWQVFIAFSPFTIVLIPDFVRMSIGPNLALPISFNQAVFIMGGITWWAMLTMAFGRLVEYFRYKKQLETLSQLKLERYGYPHRMGKDADYDALDAYLVAAQLHLRSGAYGKVAESLHDADSLWQKMNGTDDPGDFGGLDTGNGWLEGYRRRMDSLLQNRGPSSPFRWSILAEYFSSIFERLFRFNAVPAEPPKKLKEAA